MNDQENKSNLYNKQYKSGRKIIDDKHTLDWDFEHGNNRVALYFDSNGEKACVCLEVLQDGKQIALHYPNSVNLLVTAGRSK